MSTEDEARAARARARATWAGRVARDGTHAPALAPPASTPGERLAMVWRLTLDAWAFSGRAIPDYERKDAPGRVLRLTDLE